MHCDKDSGTRALLSSVYSNPVYNLNFLGVAFFLIPGLLTSL